MTNIIEIERKLEDIYKNLEDISLFNQKKVIEAFRNNKVSTSHFSGTTGYGYDDVGREILAKVFSDIFKAEKTIISPYLMCGSHALTVALFGLLRPGDLILSITGKPYDTLDETIFGKKNIDIGSLKDFKINYKQIDLKNGELNIEEIKKQTKKLKPKIVYIQRSRGYEWRNSLMIEDIEKVCADIKEINKTSYIVVDNCYGEFVEKKEPLEVGADVIVGSLIKNPGGGLATSGGYIAGKKEAIQLISYRFTSPSLGIEIGSYDKGYREFYQGLFMAPHIVKESLKGAYLIGEVMKSLGAEILPETGKISSDIIKSIKFNNENDMIKFVQKIQKYSPVDSFVVPMPWDMPGYTSPVIMAAGTFISGASIEMSCDGPIRAPYIAYFQGGLTYEQVKLLAIELLENN